MKNPKIVQVSFRDLVSKLKEIIREHKSSYYICPVLHEEYGYEFKLAFSVILAEEFPNRGSKIHHQTLERLEKEYSVVDPTIYYDWNKRIKLVEKLTRRVNLMPENEDRIICILIEYLEE